MNVSTNPKDFPVFGELTEDEIKCKVTDFVSILEYFSPEIGVEFKNIEHNEKILNKIVDMVERRRVYFHIYHEGMEMGELNEACLYCFWLLKLNPFYNKNNLEENVNRVFALALFTRVVNYTAQKGKSTPYITTKTVEKMLHGFKFWDLSKEAIMLMAQGLSGQ
ncbi:MAG: hypothetical protein LBI38_05195 [Oscillospiraceae bacterium]|nr:hypothetical protein [Oscillospiraceae bacterium]